MEMPVEIPTIEEEHKDMITIEMIEIIDHIVIEASLMRETLKSKESTSQFPNR